MRSSTSASVGKRARSAGQGRRFRSGWPSCAASWMRRCTRRSISCSESLAEVTEERDRREVENRREYENRCRELRLEHDRDWQSHGRALAHAASRKFASAASRMEDECQRLFPDWESTDYAKWPRPTEPSPAIRFGDMTLDLAQVKNGIAAGRAAAAGADGDRAAGADDARGAPGAVDHGGGGRPPRRRSSVLQLAMLRMLTAMPPGKVRFTILDPVGLGRELRVVHAPGRFRRAADCQPHLDRRAADRRAAHAAHGAHGDRAAEVSAQRVRDDPRIQRAGGRGGRAVSGARRGELSRRTSARRRRGSW